MDGRILWTIFHAQYFYVLYGFCVCRNECVKEVSWFDLNRGWIVRAQKLRPSTASIYFILTESSFVYWLSSESNLVFVDHNLMCCSTSTGTRRDSKRKERIPWEAPDTPWTVLWWLDAICGGRMPKLTVILAPENLMSGSVQTLLRTPLFRAKCYPDHPRPSDNHPDNLQPPKRHLAEMLQNLDQEKCWFSGKSARTIVSILEDINSFLGGAIRF